MSNNATRLRKHKKEGSTVALSSEESRKRLKSLVEDEQRYESVNHQKLPQFEAANQKQKTALAILHEGKKVVFLTGSAGTGKSMLAAYFASCQLKQKKSKNVYLVRPAVSVGKSVGLLPGDIKEKLTPFFMQTLKHLENFLGRGFMNYCLEKEVISMQPVEYMRGMSFEDCIVICEECQNFSKEEMEMMLTRLGRNCVIIFTGDQKQHDLKGLSGLEETVSLLNRMASEAPSYLTHDDLDELDSGVGIVQFTPEDVVRSGLTRAFVKIYYNN